MPQVLLRSNRRIAALALGCAVLGLMAAFFIARYAPQVPVLVLVGLIVSVCVVAVLLSAPLLRNPRLVLRPTELLVFVRLLGKPIHVPLEVVEVFFIGQGAVSGEDPGHPNEYRGAVAANVIVRLADAHKSWHQRKINQWLGVWADGYITIRGLWCENIDQDLLKQMNRALIAAKREMKKEAAV